MSSGSKRSAAPRELSAWQRRVLAEIAASPLRTELVFGGGAALAALYLHHRLSEDLDFFLTRPIDPAELAPLARRLSSRTTAVETEVVGPRTSLVLSRGSATFGRIDFAYYPFDPVGRRVEWKRLVVESLEDMTVNKVQALLTRTQPRDFVDLYFLLREGPLRDTDELLGLVRAKFDAGPHRLGLASRFLIARDLGPLPRMIRRVTRKKLVAFFEERAREILRTEAR